MLKILILAGGTGGHILPALAVADYLRAKGVEIHWLGTQEGLESQIVPPTGISLHYITVQAVRGKGKLAWLLAPVRMTRAIGQAMGVIRREKPDLVIGFGGFVSAPGGVAAWLLHKPFVLHEQNTAPGMTNRCLAPLARRIFQGFSTAFPASPKVVTSGNPVRASIVELPPPAQRLPTHTGPLRLLVMGGSRGAAVFNEQVPAALALIPEEKRPNVWHAAGRDKLHDTIKRYQEPGIKSQVVEFIDDIPAAYAWADLVLCRAGALTLAELCAAGLASILIPFPHAMDDHQTRNATLLANANASILLPQSALTPPN